MSVESSSEVIRKWVEKTKDDQSPLARWTATLVGEIYLSEDFAYTRLKGPYNPNSKYSPQAVRIVALDKDDIKAVSITLPWSANPSPMTLGSRLREEVSRLPYTGIKDRLTLQYARTAVKGNDRQVLSALELSQTLQGDNMVQVLYPKTYIRILDEVMSLLEMKLGDQDLRIASFGLAVKFLQSVPFINDKPIIMDRINS